MFLNYSIVTYINNKYIIYLFTQLYYTSLIKSFIIATTKADFPDTYSNFSLY